MDDQAKPSGQIYHHVATPTLIYGIVHDAALFEALPGQAETFEKLQVKTVEVDGKTIIYQMWFEKVA